MEQLTNAEMKNIYNETKDSFKKNQLGEFISGIVFLGVVAYLGISLLDREWPSICSLPIGAAAFVTMQMFAISRRSNYYKMKKLDRFS